MPVRPEYAASVDRFWNDHGGVFVPLDGAPRPSDTEGQPQNYGFGPIVSMTPGADNNVPQGSMREGYIPTARDKVQGVLDAGAAPAKAYVDQVDRTGSSIAKAVENPSMGNITGAAANTALTLGRPVAAMGALATGTGIMVGKEVLKEVGRALAPGEAGAADAPLPGLSPEQMKIYKKAGAGSGTRKRLEEISAAFVRDQQAGEQARLNAETQARIESEKQRAANDEALRASAEAQKQEEYNRSVTTAEAARDAELGRVKRFSNLNNDWKDLYDQLGGEAGAPFSVGAIEGLATRAALGPSAGPAQKIVKDWVIPTIVGGAGGFATANAPTAYNYFANDADNPMKSAMQTYGFNLPEGHPKKQEALDAARDMPDANPVRTEAAKDYFDHMGERAIIGGIEGAAGAKFGQTIGAAVGRGAGALGNYFKGSPRPQPSSPQPDMSGMRGPSSSPPVTVQRQPQHHSHVQNRNGTGQFVPGFRND